MVSGTTPGVLAKVDGKVRRLSLDSTVGAWKLQSIQGREAIFSNGAETRTLRLTYARLNGPQSAVPTATPNAAGVPPPGAQSSGTTSTAAAAMAGNTGPPPDFLRKAQEETREIIRRRNELRAANGLPPVTE